MSKPAKRQLNAAEEREQADLLARIRTLKAAKLHASARALRQKLAALRGGYEL